ncbi:MAG: GNAT family protein [Myxococcota bacterium]
MKLSDNFMRGDRLELTGFAREDAETLAAFMRDPALIRLSDPGPLDYPDPEEIWRELSEANKSKEQCVFAIRSREDRRLLGWAELDNIDLLHQNACIGLGLGDPGERGKGSGSEALGLLLAYAFRELNLHRIEARVFAYNEASLRLASKQFSLEGIRREAVRRDGRWHDEHIYALLAPDWFAAANQH